MNIADSIVNTYACIKHTKHSSNDKNTTNSTENTDTVPPTIGPSVEENTNIKPISTNTITCPANILAKRRIHNANVFVNIPIISINGIIGIGTFNHAGTSGQNISFQYSLVPKILVRKNVISANTNVIAIFPVKFAPPGNIGIIPNKLFRNIKKNAVNKYDENFL